MTETLVVTGAVGVGKTTVAWEILEVLEERGLPFGFYDPDCVHFRPVPADDPFGYEVSLAALEVIWPLMRAERLVVPMVVERREAAARLLPGADLTIVRLTAPPDVLEERIRRRELGAGLQWHLDRAVELAAHWEAHPVEDALVAADRPVREVALDVLAHAGWL